jgi:ABC-type dipeptide/oligopeptide/nickel transport system permease component
VSNKKTSRKPTAAAVIVGTFCFLLSVCIVIGVGILLFPYAKQYLNKTVLFILLSVGSLPLVFILFWLTVYFMGKIEKLFGVSFRTKSGIEKDGQ